MQVANPYQYSQTGVVAGVRKFAWGINFLGRRQLAKLPLLGRESDNPLRLPAGGLGESGASFPLKRAVSGLLARIRPVESTDLVLAPFSEPLFVLVQRGDRLPYSAALRAATTTTRTLQVATLAVLCGLLRVLLAGKSIVG